MLLYLTWCLKFSLGTFVNLLFGFSRLCALDIEPPKIVYWKEKCQWTSHRNSKLSQCMLPEDAITSFSWYENLILYLVFSFDGETCPFKPFIRLLIYCIKMHKINFQCPTFMFKGKLHRRKCWLRPLVHLQRCHFLILWSILLKTVANDA